VVAAGLATRCTIQIAYAIGVSELSLYVDTHDTGTVGDDRIEQAIKGIAKLGRSDSARDPRIWVSTSRSISPPPPGHFGRKAEGDFFPWERLDLVDDLKAAFA
jgi:S-adenosylmethionine synthetase